MEVRMEIRTTPVVPRDLFERVDDDWHQYAMVSGVATQWYVLGPIDGTAYWVVPDFNGPRANTRVTYPCINVRPLPGSTRPVFVALSNAAFQAALGIANALASEQVLPETGAPHTTPRSNE
jgi:hypothetical protein